MQTLPGKSWLEINKTETDLDQKYYAMADPPKPDTTSTLLAAPIESTIGSVQLERSHQSSKQPSAATDTARTLSQAVLGTDEYHQISEEYVAALDHHPYEPIPFGVKVV